MDRSSKPESDVLSTLLRDLGSRSPERRKQAEEALQLAGDEAASALVSRLEQAKHNYRRHRRIALWSGRLARASLVSGAVVSSALDVLGKPLRTHPSHGSLVGWTVVFEALWCIGFTAALVWLLWPPLYRLLSRRRVHLLVRAFTAIGEPVAIQPLSEAMELGDRTICRAARSALRSLLPTLQATHLLQPELDFSHLLTVVTDQKADTYDPDLAVMLLQMLERTGDPRVLAQVRLLAHFHGRTEGEKRIREAAGRCVARLMERAQRIQEGTALLRPTSSPHQQDGPLRPAAGEVGNSSSEQLLRPASTGGVSSSPTHLQPQACSENTAVLLSRIQEEMQRQKARQNRQEAVAMGVLWLGSGACICWMGLHLAPPMQLSFTAAYVLGSSGLFLSLHRRRQQNLPVQNLPGTVRQMVYELSRTNDRRAIGTLIEAGLGRFAAADVRQCTWQALIRLLPQLRASDGHMLDAHQRDLLHGTLSYYAYRCEPDVRWSGIAWALARGALAGEELDPLVLAILQALELVGDDRSIASVETIARLSGEAARTLAVRSIRDVAVQCLAALRERHDEGHAALLRPSDDRAEGSSTPLRAPAHATGTGESALLRPVAPELEASDSQGLVHPRSEV